MNISSTENHTMDHFVSLSKDQVESLLKDMIRKQLRLPSGGPAKAQQWSFTWDHDSVDSGLRKEPRIVVRLTQDLALQAEAKEA